MAGGPTLQQLVKYSDLKERREACFCLKGICYCDSLASGKGCNLCHSPVISLRMCGLPNNSG
jgi:hypothetical protein